MHNIVSCRAFFFSSEDYKDELFLEKKLDCARDCAESTLMRLGLHHSFVYPLAAVYVGGSSGELESSSKGDPTYTSFIHFVDRFAGKTKDDEIRRSNRKL
jgi:hypothetical protein